jgi:hypothetical protein
MIEAQIESLLEGQSYAGCRKTCGRGVKRTQILGMGCSTPRLAPQQGYPYCRVNGRILLANSNQWYFNNLVKKPCHKTPYRCPHRLSLSSQSSRSCALPNIKVLKDKDLEFANSIPTFSETTPLCCTTMSRAMAVYFRVCCVVHPARESHAHGDGDRQPPPSARHCRGGG